MKKTNVKVLGGILLIWLVLGIISTLALRKIDFFYGYLASFACLYLLSWLFAYEDKPKTYRLELKR